MRSKITRNGDLLSVQLKGDLIEGVSADLSSLKIPGDCKGISFDLAGVERINSFGCREWIVAISKMAEKFTIEYHNCPVIFIEYCGIIPLMLRTNANERIASVASFSVPYSCEECGDHFEAVAETANVEATRRLPKAGCPACGSEAKPEVVAQHFLSFLPKKS